MGQTAEEQKFTQVTDSLGKQENMMSLLYLVDKLPEMAKAVQSIDETMTFAQYTWNDKASMQALFDEAGSKLKVNSINTETLDSLLKMLQLLPTIVPLMEKLADVSVFVNETLQDKESLAALTKETEPVTAFFDESLDVLKETNRRVNEEGRLPDVSIFKVLHLLKDPTIRKGYQYVNTLLGVLSKKENKEA